MSVVFASSTCDLDLKVLNMIDVEVLNIPYLAKDLEGSYNQTDFNFNKFFSNSHLKINFDLLKKQAEEKLTEALKTGQDVVYLTPNAKYDFTYKIVNPLIKKLAKEYPEQKIEIVNCNNYSVGYGLIVYQAGIFNRTGENITELVKFVNKIKKEIKTFIVPSTNANIKDFLTVVGNTIGVKPILQVVGGELKIVDNIRGNKKIVEYLFEKAKKCSQDEIPVGIFVGNCEDVSNSLAEKIETINSDLNIIKSTLNPFLLNYFGNKTIAISFHKKSGV